TRIIAVLSPTAPARRSHRLRSLRNMWEAALPYHPPGADPRWSDILQHEPGRDYSPAETPLSRFGQERPEGPALALQAEGLAERRQPLCRSDQIRPRGAARRGGSAKGLKGVEEPIASLVEDLAPGHGGLGGLAAPGLSLRERQSIED